MHEMIVCSRALNVGRVIDGSTEGNLEIDDLTVFFMGFSLQTADSFLAISNAGVFLMVASTEWIERGDSLLLPRSEKTFLQRSVLLQHFVHRLVSFTQFFEGIHTSASFTTKGLLELAALFLGINRPLFPFRHFLRVISVASRQQYPRGGIRQRLAADMYDNSIYVSI